MHVYVYASCRQESAIYRSSPRSVEGVPQRSLDVAGVDMPGRSSTNRRCGYLPMERAARCSCALSGSRHGPGADRFERVETAPPALFRMHADVAGSPRQSWLPTRLARSRHSHHGHLFGERHQGWAEVSEDHAQIVNRIDNLRNILGCTYGQSRHFLNLVFLPRKGIFKGMDIISCLRYI